MKRIIISLLLILPPFTAKTQEPQTAPDFNDAGRQIFTAQYPCEGSLWANAYPNILAYGALNLQGATLKINGADTPVYKTGSYLAYVPSTPGNFDLNFEIDHQGKTYKYKRSVIIDAFDYRAYQNKYGFDAKHTFPSSELIMAEGDSVEFSAFGTPGKRVTLTLSKKYKNIEMTEDAGQPGVYKTALDFKDKDISKKPQKVLYRMYEGKRQKAKMYAAGKMQIAAAGQVIAAGSLNTQDLRPRPVRKEGYNILDTRLWGSVPATGLMDSYYRISLQEGESAWIEAKYLNVSKDFTPPNNEAEAVELTSREDKTILKVKNKEKVSFKLEERPGSFNLRLYYTLAAAPVNFDGKSALIASAQTQQAAGNTQNINLTYRPGQTLWGLKYYYSGSDLIVELIHKPHFAFTKKEPLKNLKVFLDPGHSPMTRYTCREAITPNGTPEYLPDYKTAQAAARKLKALGAEVIMSKTLTEQTGLEARVQKAANTGAQIFISVHNNSLPNNINPFTRERGFGVYYFYPHSQPFAAAMEKAYTSNVPLISNGIINMDLAVLRNTPQIPAVLLESVYMLYPEQEELLMQDSFIETLGAAVAEGVLRYVNPGAVKNNTGAKPRRRSPKAHITAKK
ncbi:MAG: N-acetylmuramoyl-L-alanine amidase [Elusimicrobiota bacterium]|jgi:N-acetylmuramoyl-L-alanine amidase|nr:N-acetylmuramoyl-L-alanine amidase [Elusimicrobiota bacterium]